ncbi:ABC transporter ATP-binding protein [Thermococcus barophilus]|uniref:ABC transporter ATP-binding protein n=1 Tax=Thermococcus barophilus (strain DSM 11836 / MP) TaxID=391623 RepID=F0LH02_THEBM|nr:ABC transporter ATP-binding protein [Thermococcus barophilus]ADT84210.1 ABC transporter ATP-binding protein [Thermococcus barophilus MP]
MPIVKIRNVSKRFGDVVALRNIDLEIEQGEFVVIAGENGSGKSTLLKIMTGLLIPDNGEVTVLGFDVVEEWKELAKHIGVALANERSLYWKLTGMENLEIFGGIYGVRDAKKKALALLERLDLIDVKDMLVENYSTGMRRKLLLAKSLIHSPKILFLDEILNGLDPKSMIEIVSFLEELNRDGITIVLVSHILHSLPSNSRLIVMKDGKIILDDALRNFKNMKTVKVKAVIGGEKIEKTVDESELTKVIKELTEVGAENIMIERDDLYAILRRIL